MLEHGGRLRQAASRYGIALSDWLDLSTGINPNGWPVPALPAECWQRLPEEEDNLLPAARDYYQNPDFLAVAGSQAAIQTLPLLRSRSRVGFLHPAYAEHAHAWQKAGHELSVVEAENIEARLDQLDVLIIINPNNPTGLSWDRQQLLSWQQRLAARGGWLLVDEAFIDSRLDQSLTSLPTRPGLIVLRSIGKFFGLAGIRCGFVFAETLLLAHLAELLGPWSISHPARHVAALALSDHDWRLACIENLNRQGLRLNRLLVNSGWPPDGGCDLFQWIKSAKAADLHDLLARLGILTRLFTDPLSLRFGLPRNESDWRRLELAMQHADIMALR